MTFLSEIVLPVLTRLTEIVLTVLTCLTEIVFTGLTFLTQATSAECRAQAPAAAGRHAASKRGGAFEAAQSLLQCPFHTACTAILLIPIG